MLNRKNVADGSITPVTVRDSQTLSVPLKDLLAGSSNRLTLARGDGTGTLYYTLRFNPQISAARAPAVSQGIIVTRQYFKGNDRKTSISSAAVGDVITVRLTITVPQNIQYFILDDKFPSGAEGIDSSLLTSAVIDQGSDVNQLSRYDAYWYWGWSYFKETDLRDSQLNLYADNLPGGTYVYTYQLRATVPGIYQTIPAYAYTFYAPEIFGRSEGTLFTISEAEK